MKDSNHITTGRLVASLVVSGLLLLLMPALSLPAFAARTSKNTPATAANSFATPDFAFPRTVESNARAALASALKKRDGINSLQAAIQICVASSLVSQDSYPTSVATFDTVASVCGSPYDALANLLEARIYTEINNPEKYSDKICSLISKAASTPGINMLPLSSITPLLENSDDAIAAGFSIGDFIASNAEPLLSTLGNAKSATSLRSELIDNAIDRHRNDSNPTAELYFCQLKLDALSGTARQNFLTACFDRYSNTPYGARFVVDYSSTLDDIRRRYELLENYQREFPDAPQIGLVEAELNALRYKSVSISFPSQLLPDRETKVKLNGRNIYSGYILLYRLPGNDSSKSFTYTDLKGLTPLFALPVKLDGVTPESVDTVVVIPSLQPGLYAPVPSSTEDADGLFVTNSKSRLSITQVSNLSIFSTAAPADTTRNLYVTSAYNAKPLSGAKVTVQKLKNGRRGEPEVLLTDKEGKVEVPRDNLYYSVELDGNFRDGTLYASYAGKYDDKEIIRATILTDLSIYHPGDTVRFESIAYTIRDKSLRIAPDRKFDFILSDANGQPVDTLTLTSDPHGRLTSHFLLPTSPLLGPWSITAQTPTPTSSLAGTPTPITTHAGTTSFQLSAYKSPTFFVTLTPSSIASSLSSSASSPSSIASSLSSSASSPSSSALSPSNFEAVGELQFSGQAQTYTGMPVPSAKVAFTLTSRPAWWRPASSVPISYGGETTTAPDGSFTLSLPADSLKNACSGAPRAFTLSVSVTDPAGETQSAPSLLFSLSNLLYINPEIPAQINADSSADTFPVQVLDIAGHPVETTVYYQIVPADKTATTPSPQAELCGVFKSPSFVADLSKLASGRYAFRFSLNPEFKSDSISMLSVDSVTIWRPDDKRPPFKTPLWVAENEIHLPAGAKTAKVRVGSSYQDSYVLALVSNSRSQLSSRWLKVSDGFVNLLVDAPSDNERIFVKLLAEHDLSTVTREVTIIPHYQDTRLEVTAESFRDRIEPGARESWKFRFELDGRPCVGIPVSAVMSNKALNAINPFSWSFNPQSMIYWSSPVRLSFSNPYQTSNSAGISVGTVTSPVNRFVAPEWNTYGQQLYGNMTSYVSTRFYANSMMKSAVKTSSAAEGSAETTEDSAEMTNATPAISAGVSQQHAEPLRQVNLPLAFFKPDLFTDASGVATVDFIVPDFVGTWQFQIMGYTPDMKGNVLTLDAVASKKVMVQMNAPRFVRTGDNVSVSATAYNNSDEQADVALRIEILDAVSSKTLMATDFNPEAVSASGSRTATSMFAAPSDINAITIRVYASTPGHRDGEQTVVPVLPSSAPVIESTPFYIPGSQSAYEVKLPELDPDAQVTLTYCDNPVWECVTALPDLLNPESANLLSRIYALYGNAVADGLFSKYPTLMTGVKALAADSALVSPLELNDGLKTVVLDNTPWVNDAQAETLRMQRLVEYADSENAKKVIASTIDEVARLQNPDGGWSWCPGMQSSAFMTARVLHMFASLSDMGYLPAAAEKLVKPAFAYMDNEYAEAWNKSKRKDIPVSALLGYLTDKSAFDDVTSTSTFKPLETAAMKAIVSGWREFDIEEKATAVILFDRRHDTKLARTLLESLRQFASVSPEKGMWFDNLSYQRNPSATLLTTARVLKAYNMVEPQAPAVAQLRQWLILSKQTRNWGGDRMTAEVINAILTSCDGMPAAESAPVISLDGNALDLTLSGVTGSVTCNLDANSASGATLNITRPGNGSAANPAWGGVVAQYVAPINSIEAVAVPQLRITKNMYVLKSGADGTSVSEDSYKVGDRVRVSLTIACDRDLDYVAVCDPRPACFEPLEQLSSYTSSGGVWYYREVRDSQTNLFIPYLSKGTHVISYECTIDRVGEYAVGAATAQSEYAPEITAHSAGSYISIILPSLASSVGANTSSASR